MSLLAPPDLAQDEAPYPPAPWRLRGEAVVVPVPVRVAAARRPVPADLPLVSVAGRTAGGLLLASYGDGATLGYRELIVFAGTVRAGGHVGMWISHIYVDLPASVAGGRRIWGLPKELAEFAWLPGRVGVAGLLDATVRLPRRTAPLPLLAPVFGRREGRLVFTASRGTLRGAPVRVRVEVPPGSPFAGLGLQGRRLGLAGHGLDLPFGEPRAV